MTQGGFFLLLFVILLDLHLHGVLYLLEGLVGLLPRLQQVLRDATELRVRDFHLSYQFF